MSLPQDRNDGVGRNVGWPSQTEPAPGRKVEGLACAVGWVTQRQVLKGVSRLSLQRWSCVLWFAGG